MRRILSFAGAGAVLTAVALVQLGPVPPSVVVAHPGPHPPGPPTYDYDTGTPGTQPPTSLLLADPTGRLMTPFRLSVTAFVPLAELQAVLPAGFTANPLPPPNPPDLAALSLSFEFQAQCEHAGTVGGPASGLYVLHFARNAGRNRNEFVVLAAELSDRSFVECHRAIGGPGGSRVADVEVETKEAHGQLQFKFNVEDEALGLRVAVRAVGPAAIVARGIHSDPVGVPLSTVNDGIEGNPALFFATMGDTVVVPTTSTNLALEVRNKDKRLRLPGGSVTLVRLGQTFSFIRALENVLQRE